MNPRRNRMNLEAIASLADLADYSIAFALRAIAKIGVADHLEEGPQRIGVLAERCGCDAHGLLRVMRALATKEVFSEDEPEVFGLKPIGDLLRTDHPLSMRWFFRLEPDVRALAGLEYSLRTGKPAFDEIFGKPYFDWMAENPGPREWFSGSQRALNRLELLTIARAYPWQEIRSIVDVGGNDGSLVAALVQRNPQMRGTVFDLPDTAALAAKVLADIGVTDRTEIVCGDILEGGIPAGADLYNIKRVLVGYDDEEAVRALSSIRSAMAPHSRLLIMEPMRYAADQVGVSLDLLMLVLGLGRVRTPEEFYGLLERAGLKSSKTISAGLLTIIEARKVAA